MSIRRSSSYPTYAGAFRKDRVGNPNAGCCTLCRSSQVSAERPCVELGQNAKPFREGMVVVCFNCATEIGAAVGMMSQADAVKLRDEVAELRGQVEYLDSELGAFEQLRGALETLRASELT